MKIAISSTGNNLESEADARFGRCSYFLIVEIEKNKIKDFKAIENVAKEEMRGAGITAAETVANENVEAVIGTNLGPRAFLVFEQLKIKVYHGSGKIKKVITDFIDGKLQQLKSANGPQNGGL